MTRSTDLYFEAHVTLDPVFGDVREGLRHVAQAYGFRLAELVLRRSGTSETPHTDDAFITARARTWAEIESATKAVVCDLQRLGYTVRRYKIENTLIDSKTARGDPWGLLR